MTALTLAGQLAAIGGEQVAIAAGWTLLAIGAVAGVAWSLWHIARWTRETMRAYPHRYEAPAQQELGDDTLAMIRDAWTPASTLPPASPWLSENELTWLACKWCHDPTCIDSTLCSCKVPCGRMLCKSPAVARG